MGYKNLFSGILATCLLAPFTSNACTQSEVDAVTSVYVEVGMWGAAFNGGYIAAAYERLGEELDQRESLNSATSVFVTFTYSASLFGVQGTSMVNLCLEREEGETWESITKGLLDVANSLARSAEDGFGDTYEGGSGMEPLHDSLTFPPNSTVVIGGWGSRLGGPRRGRVTCQPACF